MTERTHLIQGALILLVSSCMALRKEEFPLIQSNPQACWKHSGVVPANLHVCDPDGLVSDLDGEYLGPEATKQGQHPLVLVQKSKSNT